MVIPYENYHTRKIMKDELKKYRNIIVEDAIDANNVEQLQEVLFSDELEIDVKKLIDFLMERLFVYGSDYDNATQEKVKEYINELANGKEELEIFLLKLKEEMITENKFSEVELMKLDYWSFWTMFAIAIKKCISSPHSKISDINIYFSKIDINTFEQKKAHEMCIDAFQKNADYFTRRNSPQLKLFLHQFHSKNKRVKTKKKNLHRVLKTTRKIMNIKKIMYRNESYNIFKGKCEVVPGQFSERIVDIFLS